MSQQIATFRNKAKDKMIAGEVISSMTVRLVQSVEIVPIAKSAGLDMIYIDLEHSSFSMQTCSQICVAALQAELPCLVRVPNGRSEYVSRVLDGGAVGVIVPDVRSVDDARRVVMAAKYAPLGARGLSGALPQLGFRPTVASQACPIINNATLVVVQLESEEAVAGCEDIVAVDGVDMVLVGANDLLADMGIAGEFDDPRLLAAYERILVACKNAGKFMGIGGLQSRPDIVVKLVMAGANYVSGGTDLAFLLGAATGKSEEIKRMSNNRKATEARS